MLLLFGLVQALQVGSLQLVQAMNATILVNCSDPQGQNSSSLRAI
jgi:hypothetical protein